MGFVNRGPFAAKLVPTKVRLGSVLDGVIAHGLVVGMGVSGAQIKEFVAGAIRPRPEGDANKAGHADPGGSSNFQGDVALDGSILKVAAAQEREAIEIAFGRVF